MDKYNDIEYNIIKMLYTGTIIVPGIKTYSA